MDKTSKKIINLLSQYPDDILWYDDETYEKLEISEDEFFRCVNYLDSQNLIEFVSNQSGHHLGIKPSHFTVHRKEMKRDAFKKWFFHSFLGGVITGVFSTLAAEGLFLLGAKIIMWLQHL